MSHPQTAGRPGFSFLICPDVRLLKERTDALLAQHQAGHGSGAFERRVYWGDEELPGTFWQDLTVPSLFGAPRAVVVRRAQLLPAETWAALAGPLRGFNAGVWPFFCLEGTWDKSGPKIPKWIAKQKYFEVAEKRGWVWRSQGLTQDSLAGFLREWTAARGLSFSQAGLAAFCQALPKDAGAVALEMDKVALGLGDRREIGPEDAALVSFQPGIEFFDLLRFLEKGDKAGALKVWRKVADSELGSDEMLFPFLGLLVREARALWSLYNGEPAQIPPFVRAAKEDMARRLGPAKLARIWELAMDAEHGVKSGGRSPQQALELLMADLFSLFRP